MSAPRHPNQRPMATLPVELRRTTVPAAAKAWIKRSTGQSVVRAERLPGASSTAVHRLVFPDRHSLVLRRYVWPGFLDDEPIAPQRELDALSFGSGHDLSVPHVVAADITGNDIGDGVPAILMTFLRGRALASPDPVRLAETAATVHAVDPSASRTATSRGSKTLFCGHPLSHFGRACGSAPLKFASQACRHTVRPSSTATSTLAMFCGIGGVAQGWSTGRTLASGPPGATSPPATGTSSGGPATRSLTSSSPRTRR